MSEEKLPKETEDYVKIIESVPLLAQLSRSEVVKLADKLKHEHFAVGKALMSQGEVGDKFYIIKKGQCEVKIWDGHESKVIATLEKGDYCGEQAMIYKDAKRNATITAKIQTECLTLDRANFMQIFQDSNVLFARRDAKRIAIQAEPLQDMTIDKSKISVKSIEQIEWLLSCIQKNELFENYSSEQKVILVEHMTLKNVEAFEVLIRQGDDGNEFYVIEKGLFKVSIDNTVIKTVWRGMCVGELALIYNAPRSATVEAIKPCSVWYLDRLTFRKILMQHNQADSRKKIDFLMKVPLLSPLIKSELQLLEQALETKKFKKGETIFKKGDQGEYFYIVKSGIATGHKETGSIKNDFRLKSGDFFGERALLTEEPRSATIACETDVILMLLSTQDFREILGPLEDIMARHTEKYENGQECISQKRTSLLGKYPELQQLKDNTKGLLGIGGFGRVTLVIDEDKQKSYALKALSKLQIIQNKQINQTLNEKKVLKRLNSMFVVNLKRTYKDDLFLYFLLDACLGGELFAIHRKVGSFDEAAARFFVGCVVEGFDHIHSNKIAYRDLKPENLVLDSDGYLKIADFGLSKFIDGNSFTMCGTPDYLAPEMLTGKGHGLAVDWWALGVFIFELVAAQPPFSALTMNDTFKRIMAVKIKFPKVFSYQCKRIINGLIKKRPHKRLGIIKGGTKLIRKHRWFKGFDWESLRLRKMTAAFKPKVKTFDDISNFSVQGEKFGENYKFKLTNVDMSWADDF